MASVPARRIPRCRQPKAWDALANLEVFIYAAEAELAAMDRERTGVHRCGRKPDPDRRRRVLGLIWMLTFGGMQWRIAGFLSGVPFTTLHSAFARWTRLGLWRRLGQRLAFAGAWPVGTTPCPQPSWPTAARSAPPRVAGPSCWMRGIDGGKLVKGIKRHAICDKHGWLLDLELTPAHVDDRAGTRPMLPRLAELGF